MSATDWIKTNATDDVPRLDIPARKRAPNKIDLAVAEHELDETAEREFNETVFGDLGLGPGNDTVSESEIRAAAEAAEAYAEAQSQTQPQPQATKSYADA